MMMRACARSLLPYFFEQISTYALSVRADGTGKYFRQPLRQPYFAITIAPVLKRQRRFTLGLADTQYV